MAPHFYGLSEAGKKALVIEKIGPRCPMTRKRLIRGAGDQFFPLGKRQYLEWKVTKLATDTWPYGPIRPRKSGVH